MGFGSSLSFEGGGVASPRLTHGERGGVFLTVSADVI